MRTVNRAMEDFQRHYCRYRPHGGRGRDMLTLMEYYRRFAEGERERLGEGREKEGRPEGREGGREGRERGRKRGQMSSEGLEHCNIMRNTKIVDT